MTDAGEAPQTTFFEEFKEVAGDLIDAYQQAILDTDHRTVNLLHVVLDTAMTIPDPQESRRALVGTFMWCFMLGREHHARGYAAPFGPDSDEREANDDVFDEAIRHIIDVDGDDG